MSLLKCPVCSLPLEKAERCYLCLSRHSFDIARHGYVNLLMSNKASSKRHGDDRLMVLSRQAFLEKGYYSCLRDRLSELAVRLCGSEITMLDAGCGEGWYTLGVKSALESTGKSCLAIGIDISKDALIQAARRSKELTLAVAGVNALPVSDGECDLLLNVFAPNDDAEFARAVKGGGVLLKAVPLQRHLMELKAAIYDRPYENPPAAYAPEGFELLAFEEVRTAIHLPCQEDIWNLFTMTPYYYKTGRADQEKLRALNELDVSLEFGVFALRRK